MAWLEGEGARERRPVRPPPTANDPDPRGWVQVGVCVFLGTLVAALLVCWVGTEREQVTRVTLTEQLRLEGFRRAAGDPVESSWRKGEGVKLRSNGGAFGLLLCVRAFAIAFGTAIGALFLRGGCALYNELAGGKGSPSGVPEPPLGKAMGITFVTTLVHAVLGFELLAAPISLLVMAGMCSALLPTTFIRGLLVALCYLLVGLFAVVVLAVIFGGLRGGFKTSLPEYNRQGGVYPTRR